MMTRPRAFAALNVLAGALAIASAPWARDARWLDVVFKPVATLAVIAYAFGCGHDTPAIRRRMLAGLVLSLAGDVTLL